MINLKEKLEIIEPIDLMEIAGIFKHISKKTNKLYILLNVEVPNEQLRVYLDNRPGYFGEVKTFANRNDADMYLKYTCKELRIQQKYMKTMEITIEDLVDIGHKLSDNQENGIIITLNKVTDEGLSQVDVVWDHNGN